MIPFATIVLVAAAFSDPPPAANPPTEYTVNIKNGNYQPNTYKDIRGTGSMSIEQTGSNAWDFTGTIEFLLPLPGSTQITGVEIHQGDPPSGLATPLISTLSNP